MCAFQRLIYIYPNRSTWLDVQLSPVASRRFGAGLLTIKHPAPYTRSV